MPLAQVPAVADDLAAAGRVVGVNTMIIGGLGVAMSVREVEALLAGGPLREPIQHAA